MKQKIIKKNNLKKYLKLYQIMPKTLINYQDTIIYKICCNDLNVKYVYVEHTTNFIKRKAIHKSSCNNSGGKQYNF